MKRYIKKVTLKNFQSYSDHTVEFTSGLNVLEGTSDSGKSAILRAISFVLHNSPRKDSFILRGATEMAVTVEFSDGVKVTRIKGENKNAVHAIDAEGKVYEKEKFDKEYSDDIKALLGNPPKDDYNGFISYADQFSPLFLINLNPADLPRALSSLTGVHFLEDTAKLLMQNYKSIDKQNKLDDKDCKNLQQELENYNFVDEADVKLQKAQKLLEKIAELEARKTNLEKYLPYVTMSVNDETLSKYEADLEKLNDAKAKLQIILETQNRISNLEKYVELSKIKTTNELVSEYQSILDKASGASKVCEDIAKLIEKQNKLQVFKIISETPYNENYQKTVQSIYDKSVAAKNTLNELDKKMSRYDYLSKYSKQISDLDKSTQSNQQEYDLIKAKLNQAQTEFDKYKQWLIDEKIQCDKCGSFVNEAK
jgi:exonuclease SbcC